MGLAQGNPQWSKKKILQLHERLGLKQSQIYKWNWDMLRKNGDVSANGASFNDNSHLMGTAMFDESGDDIQDCSETSSMSGNNDMDMDDTEKCAEAQEVN